MKPPKCRICGKEEWRHICGFDASRALVAKHLDRVAARVDAAGAVTKVSAVTKLGRPKVHVSGAEKQRAYRERQKSKP